MKRLLPLILFLCPLALHSQSSFLIPVQTTTGQGISGATVTLTCTDTTNGCVGNGPFSATSTNGNAAFTAIPAGNYTVAITGPNLTTFSYAYTVGSQPNGAAITPSSIDNFIFLDGKTYPQTQTGLQAAINAAAAKTLFVPPGIYSINTATPLTVPAGTNIIGSGVGTSLSVTGTGNLFNFSNGNVNISNLNVAIATATSRSGACLFNALTSGGSSITLSNLTFNANVSSPNNGKTFCLDVSGTAQWNIYFPLWIGPAATWQSFIEGIGTTTTVSGINVYNPVASNTLTCSDACIITDTLTDTWKFFGGQIPPASGNAINVRNTGAGTQASWIEFNGISTECGGPTSAFADLKIDDGRDISYFGYMASCQNAAQLNGGNRLNLHDISITNIGQHCIVQTATPTQVDVHDDHFQDCGVNTTNTYDYINILSGANSCNYHDNTFRQLNANKARFVITGTGAVTNCNFHDNDASQPTMGSGYNNTAGGFTFQDNRPAANFPNSWVTGVNAGGNLAGIYDLANQGNPCTNGEIGLSAGWGTTAAASAVAGLGQTCQWTITSNGTGQAANPTVTDTLTNALPSATVVCELRAVGGTGAVTPIFNQTALSSTAPVFTSGAVGGASFTPVAASTYIVVRRCGP